MEPQDIGLIGLAVMGQNLALNMARHGFRVAVFNRTPATTEKYVAGPAQGASILPTFDWAELAAALERPRRVMMMVKAGEPVDATLGQLRPHLEPGDVVIDGGNSHFRDTERRMVDLAQAGIHFLGVGISGGEEGALRGPSIMPGGPEEAYRRVEPIFSAIAARAADGEPCSAYLGPGGSGHYVKMVHNGIEYAVMQLIAEVYDVLQRGLAMSADQLAELFAAWNQIELSSFLIEITAKVFVKLDPETGRPLVDLILDEAEQKGTGRWTSEEAFALGVPTPTIHAAVAARALSALKEQRSAASRLLAGSSHAFRGDRQRLIDALQAGLYASIVCSYAQGMALLRAASLEHGYGLELATTAKIWRAGCIIRAALLEDIRAAYSGQPDLTNLLLDDHFRAQLLERQGAWRAAVAAAVELGIPAPALSASLAYFDGYRQERSPANLIQAQRDDFGAHTYRRVDREGVFHSHWSE